MRAWNLKPMNMANISDFCDSLCAVHISTTNQRTHCSQIRNSANPDQQLCFWCLLLLKQKDNEQRTRDQRFTSQLSRRSHGPSPRLVSFHRSCSRRIVSRTKAARFARCALAVESLEVGETCYHQMWTERCHDVSGFCLSGIMQRLESLNMSE